MKSSFCTILLLTALLSLAVASWDKHDYEIFRLKDEIELHEGPDVTFYDFIGIKPGASQEDIGRAYRKRSKLLHPDKAEAAYIATKAQATAKSKAGKKPEVHVTTRPSEREISAAVKEATERFTRLGLIYAILKDGRRKRYDHFLSNGFPKWRGTGYYYARFRPGLVTTLLGLFVFYAGLIHYVVLVLGWKRQQEFVGKYIRQARKLAWGDETGIMGIGGLDATGSIPPSADASGHQDGGVALNRKQKRQRERESKKSKDAKKEHKRSRSARRSGTNTPLDVDSVGPQGNKKRVQAENGKTLLVDSLGNVYLEEEGHDGKMQQLLLDPNEHVKPTFRDTLLFRLPLWAFNTTKNRILGRSTKEDVDEVESSPVLSGI